MFAGNEGMKVPQLFYIDIVDACNLHCVDCPRGQIAKNTSRRLAPDHLARILDKAQSECDIHTVGLYNWAEPFLHPELPEMVRVVTSRAIACWLSTNLALRRIPTLERVIQQRPSRIVVSVSGFSQEVYRRYHKGGNIETVKSNLMSIAELMKKYGSHGVTVQVDYLQFNDNAEEAPLMKRFCEDLGIGFQEKPAVGLGGDGTGESKKRLLPLPERKSHQLRQENQQPQRHWPCRLLDDTMAIDASGDVYLCCAAWYYPKFYIGNYMDLSLRELCWLRMRHPKCEHCTRHRRKPRESDLFLRYSCEANENEHVVPRKKEIERIRGTLLQNVSSWVRNALLPGLLR
jgi:MoaA/NifB/PqqE/SkfB family radical SAM enzyme